MKISKEEIHTITQRVLTYYIRKKESDQKEERILFLAPGYPVGLPETLAQYELYGELDRMDIFLEKDWKDQEDVRKLTQLHRYCGEEKADVSYILKHLTHYQEVGIYAPSFDFLKKLKEAQETDLFVRIAVYFLVAGKKVVAYVPYTADQLPEGRFGRTVRELTEDLWDMGICFEGLQPVFEEAALAKEDSPGLITEQTIEQYDSLGCRRIRAAKGTIVTPLARELAKERNIQIIR